ncbi:site-specific DNA-methyltransferase [bacterium]|nr:site-specific DNA-methyltransferase [bacterium]
MSATVLQGDCRDTLAQVEAGSVQCCVTSPPYWGLRDYGTATWEGGSAGCDHKPKKSSVGGDSPKQNTNGGSWTNRQFKENCGKCGAKRIDKQIGQEPTPEQYVETLVGVFREVRRCLHESGTVWLNLGDTYASNPAKGGSGPNGKNGYGEGYARAERRGSGRADGKVTDASPRNRDGSPPTETPEKNLHMIPWRVAIALQQDGWWVRSVICWHKRSCMPESVTDRPTSSWEPIFLLAKSSRYYYDAAAVREPAETGANGSSFTSEYDQQTKPGLGQRPRIESSGRNQRNVWSLGPEPYSEAHFATFPSEIPRRAILAGTSAKGCCPKCYAPWGRLLTEATGGTIGRSWHDHKDDAFVGNRAVNEAKGGHGYTPPSTVGWRPGCECCGLEIIGDQPQKPGQRKDEPDADFAKRLATWENDMAIWRILWSELAPRYKACKVSPCTVLDPFGGSGTVGMVALELGRDAILCELNPDYLPMIDKRTNVTKGLALA